jgi:hypothetical protein
MNIPLMRVHIFSIFVHGLQEFGQCVGRFGHPRHVLVIDKYMNDLPKYWKIFCVPALKEMVFSTVTLFGVSHL